MQLPETRELEAALRGGKAPVVVLVAGEDEAVREQVIGLVQGDLGRTCSPVDVTRGDAGPPKSDVWDRVKVDAMTVPLFGQGVVWVVENMGSGGQGAKELDEVLAKRPSHLRLVLLADEKARGGALAKAVLAAGGLVVLAQVPKAREAVRLIQALAREAGIAIEARAQESLADLVGPDRATLESVIRSIRDLVGPGGRVAEGDLLGMVQRSRQNAPWDLPDAVVERDLRKALKVAWRDLEDAKRPGEEMLAILGRVVRQVQQIRMAQDLVARKVPSDEAMEVLKLRHEFKWEALRKGAGRYTPEELDAVLREAPAWETRLKRGPGRPETLVTALLTRVILPRGKGRRESDPRIAPGMGRRP
ncbi:MAG TPA: hypothetical protein PLQ97_09065 [Myxococcota bacterium]|nr:hypothetical protein [Myxococcota bacterium]HQK52517.1 hypothetical protein [Myxococcota bacterium]